MKILILGGTGRTGKWLVSESLKRGYDINLLVRNKNKVKTSSEKINIYEGTPINISDLKSAAYGCEAILSALNISRVNDFPWAKLRTPKDFLNNSMKNIIEVANNEQINRIIFTSAWGVNDTKREVPGWFKWIINNSNVKYPYLGHEQQESIIQSTELAWTSIRAVGLTNSKNNKKIKVSNNGLPKPSLMISRQNVARFMLNCLQNKVFVQQYPVISEY